MDNFYHDPTECTLRLDKDFMKNIVGDWATRNVFVLSDGRVWGYVLTNHYDDIRKAYAKETQDQGCTCDILIKSRDSNIGVTYFEVQHGK